MLKSSLRSLATILVLMFSFWGTAAQAAYTWIDSFTKQWRTYSEACFEGELNARTDAYRKANPSQIYSGNVTAIGFVTDTEILCRGEILRRVAGIFVQVELVSVSIFRTGAPDVCSLGVLLDAETGLCGSQKCNAQCCSIGSSNPNPINHVTGTKYLRELDYAGVGNHPLMFERYYNSRDLANTPLGKVWRHTYSRSLVPNTNFPPTDGQIRLTRDDGRVLIFTLTAGTITADPDISERLTRISTGWVLTDLSDRRETYDEEGRLLSIADRAGQTITLTYTAGKLASVRDAFGRVLTLSYDASDRLSGMTNPDGKTTTYGYDASSRLSTVTRPDTFVRTYLYNEAAQTGGTNLPDALTGLIDETGQRYATWTYDAQGRATSSRLGTGATTQRYQITYNTDGTSTVTDPLNTARVYTSAVSFGVARLAAVSQPCPTCGGTDVQSQTFDSNGNVATRIDFNGNRTNYTFDLARDLETLRVEGLTAAGATTPRTRTITSQWHPTWRLPQRIAEPKRITTYIYSGDLDGASTVTCGATGALCRVRMQATTDLTGSAGFGATATGAPRVINYTYNAAGQRLTEDGARTDVTDVTTWTYNATTGNVTQISNALSQLTQFTSYDGNGRPLTVVDPNNVSTTFTYDYRGLPATRTTDSQTTTFTYTQVGKLRRVTLPDASYVDYTYDAAQRLATLTDNLNNQRIYTRDDAGNVTREETRNADGSTARLKTRQFDGLSRLFRELGALNQTTEFGYDTNGNLKTIQDPRSTVASPIVTTNVYDELNRLTQITDAAKPTAGITRFTYDGLNQLTQVIAPNGATTTYTVDGLGNVTQEVSPDRGTVNYTQDAAGNVITRTDARGITATIAYDALNRLASITYPTAGENVTFTYDRISPTDASCTNGVGRLCRVVDAGGTTSHAFDPRGNLTRMTRLELGQTYVTQYTYTGADRIATITTPTGKTFTMGRDALGRVASISGTIAGAATNFVQGLTYTAEGKVTSETFGDNVRETTTWDTDGREGATTFTTGTTGNTDVPLPPWAWAGLGLLLLGALAYAIRNPRQAGKAAVWALLWLLSATLTLLPAPARAVDTSRSYDAANNLIGRTNAGGSFTYTYDELNRLKAEAGPPKTQTFAYDGNGNRTSDGAGTYGVLANSNRYTTIRGTGATYDAAGNLTGGISTGTPATAKTFTYNQAGRLSEVRTGTTLLATYTYNSNGQRTRKALTAAGAQLLGLAAIAITIVYHHDQAGNLLAETTSASVAIRTYVWRQAGAGALSQGGLDVPAAQVEHPNNSTSGGSNQSGIEFALYFACDDLATPREVRNGQGARVWSWYAAAFGDTAPNEDVDGNAQRTVVNLRFPGQYFDAEVGLYYNWNRTYDPSSGRYLESDPAGLIAGSNTFLYVLARPVSISDVTGLSCSIVQTSRGENVRDESEDFVSTFTYKTPQVELEFAPDADFDPYERRIKPLPGVSCTLTGTNVWQVQLLMRVFYYQYYEIIDECYECSDDAGCGTRRKSSSNCRSFEKLGRRGPQLQLPYVNATERLVDFIPYDPPIPLFLCTPLPFPPLGRR